MSQQDEEAEEMKQTSREDGEEGEEEEEEEDDGENGFANNHDLIGVKGIITAQKNEIEKKKVSYRQLGWQTQHSEICCN